MIQRFLKRRSIRIVGVALFVLVCASAVPHGYTALRNTMGFSVAHAADPDLPARPTSTASSSLVASSTAPPGSENSGSWLDPISWLIGGARVIISWIGYVIAWIIIFFGSLLVAIEGWFLEIVITINTQVVNSPPVHFGFSVALSFANLGFVFAVIIMAIMTIVRFQSYGVKAILWKVVVAAIAVNFSLIIAGTILNFSDSLSLYLMRHAAPGSGGDDSSVGVFQFTNAIANSLNPAKAYPSGYVPDKQLEFNDITAQAASTGASFYQQLFSIFIAAFYMIAIIMIFGAIIVMFMIRYIYLAILLVLMPFAWLTWVFPNTKKHFSDWWSKFIKWTFFGPAALFFMYLAMQTATVIGADKWGPNNSAGFVTPGKVGATGFFQGAVGNAIQEMVQQQLPSIIVMVLMGAGLVAASSMGVKFADTTLSSVKKMGNSAKGYAKGKAINTANRARTIGQETKKGETTTQLQRLGSAITGSFLGKVPGVKGLGSVIARQGVLDPKKIEEEAKKKEEAMRGDTRAAVEKRIKDLNPTLSSDSNILGTLNKAIKTPGMLSKMAKDDPVLMEKLMGRMEKIGKGKDLAEASPELAVYQRQRAVGQVEVQRDAAGKVIGVKEMKPKDGAEYHSDDETQRGRITGEALKGNKEAEKVSADLFAKLNEKTGKMEANTEQMVAALSVNNSMMRKFYNENPAAMESFTVALATMRKKVEDVSKKSIEDMDAKEIQIAAAEAGYALFTSEATQFQRQIALVNDHRIVGYSVPGLASSKPSKRRKRSADDTNTTT